MILKYINYKKKIIDTLNNKIKNDIDIIEKLKNKNNLYKGGNINKIIEKQLERDYNAYCNNVDNNKNTFLHDYLIKKINEEKIINILKTANLNNNNYYDICGLYNFLENKYINNEIENYKKNNTDLIEFSEKYNFKSDKYKNSKFNLFNYFLFLLQNHKKNKKNSVSFIEKMMKALKYFEDYNEMKLINKNKQIFEEIIKIDTFEKLNNYITTNNI